MIIPKRCIYLSIPPFDVARLREGVDALAFRECLKEAEESFGFVPVDEAQADGPKVRVVDRYVVLNLRHDRKKLNKVRLSRLWRAEIAKREKETGMRFDKVKRDEVREDVSCKLYKETIPEETYYKAVIDINEHRLYLMLSQPAHAEFFVEKLNRALKPQNVSISFTADSLPHALEGTLTQWVADPESAAPLGFEVGVKIDMKGDNQSVASLRNQHVETAEVREHLHAGKTVQKLALVLRTTEPEAKVPFVLTSKKVLSQIDLKKLCEDSIKEERANHSEAEAALEAELLIYMQALSDLCARVDAIPHNGT